MRIYEIPFSQIGSRIIVKRKEVETVMMNLKSVKTMQERPIKSTKTITDFYSAKEIEEKYQISYSRLYVGTFIKYYKISQLIHTQSIAN